MNRATALFLAPLLASSGLFGCSAPSPDVDDPSHRAEAEDDITAGDSALVYFTPGEQDPGLATRCFAGSAQAAKTILERKEFVGRNDVTGFVVERSGPQGRTLRLRYDYFGEPFVTELRPCSFTVAQTTERVACTVRIADHGDLATPRDLVDYARQLDGEWRALDPASGVVDCATKTVRNVTNTWRQDFTVAQALTVRDLVARDRDLVTRCASVGLSSTPGLEREQRWSGLLGIDLFTSLTCPEVADASILQISLTNERAAWERDVGIWTPWGLRIVSLECDGMPKVENPAFRERSPLDPNKSAVTAHCK